MISLSLLCLKEARALLGRYEYQKGNIEAALHVFEGIDITAITTKIMISIPRRGDRPRRRSQDFSTPPMSMHAVSLLLEAIFLKAKSLQALGRFGGTVSSVECGVSIFTFLVNLFNVYLFILVECMTTMVLSFGWNMRIRCNFIFFGSSKQKGTTMRAGYKSENIDV